MRISELSLTLKAFIEARPAINLSKFEEEAGLPKKTLSHIKSGERELGYGYRKDYNRLREVMKKYGWDGQYTL
ncbi:hypothetical protein [Sanyastnella coralliicola]|uniref:hypothetical protein n=1 Tax=Sanyastnella coralliicola TaxID=3069118 RepID=UPI0027BA19B9|nr:hypothetical protein [Longitalea sp. SCSIO 12813]